MTSVTRVWTCFESVYDDITARGRIGWNGFSQQLPIGLDSLQDNTRKFSLKANRRCPGVCLLSQEPDNERESKQRQTGTQERRDKTQSIPESRCRK